MDHPHIIKVYEFYEDVRSFYIVTDFCPGGQLFDFILESGQLNEKTTCRIMHQIMSAILYCHNNNIVHRDLKPENILLADENNQFDTLNIKLIDFGTSAIAAKDRKLKGCFGTPYYIAPEILRKEAYSSKCDVWSVGVIFYILLCGYPPFNGEDDEEIMKKV